MSTKQIETIPLDAIIEIKMSGAFFARIQQLVVNYSSQKTPEEFKQALENLKSGEPKNEFEYHLLTLMVLMTDFEARAKEQDKIKMQDYPKVG